MSVVRINAIEVPEGMGATLEERFAQRLGAVDQQPGFEGFELLRPTGEAETRYFVVTHWRSVEDFDAWVNSPSFGRGHASDDDAQGGGHPGAAAGGGHPGAAGGGHPAPVSTGSSLLEFDVVLKSSPGSTG